MGSRYCLNCGHHISEKYCPRCGQAASVGRISWKSFGEEFIHTLTHAEKSIGGTTWQLTRHPGKVLDEYLSGKRKKYQPVVGFFLVWVTLSIVIHRIVIARNGFHPVYLPGLTFRDAESIEAFVVHGEWFYILTFPVSAALFYFILARPLYTYIESLVITIYAFSNTYMFFVLCYIIGGGVLSWNVLHWRFYLFQIVLSLVYTLWVCVDLFRHKGVKHWWLWLAVYMVVNLVVVLRFLELLSRGWVTLEHVVHL